MGEEPAVELEREERRNRVLLAYVEALASGREPDRAQLLGDYPDIRDDLEEFLAGHDEVARLSAPLRAAARSEDRPPIGPRRDPTADAPPGIGELGDFRLIREVGRGGMGVVYEAEQISLRRRVALKVLPFAAAIDPRRLHRFKTEALAASHVQHEKIVPVHAVGCERGVHYFAMQFIDGQSLAALIAELRLLRDRPDGTCAWSEDRGEDASSGRDHENDLRESTSGREATLAATTISRERSSDRRGYFDRMAGLGRQAALALEQAHQAGIVHRDIKPGNLLLDLRGQLWVTDFGLARVAGDAGLTITGEMLGTLRYASPEQILARRAIVDHRSDVYSPGATLYELLTLRPPFESRDRNELIRQIADDDPPLPCALDPYMPRGLETIVLKALRKDPADRYGSAQEMADDLQRYLDGRPILARRPTAADRVRAWARRHPTVTGAGVVALLLVTVASLISAALIRREQARTLAEQRKAEAAYRQERGRAEEAEARFRLARRAVDELIRMSEEELAHRPGMEGLRKRLLGSALAYYREFIEQRRSDPDAQSELRDTSRRVETILADLAVLRAAGQLYLLVQTPALDDLGLDAGQRARVVELSSRAGRRWMEIFGDPGHRPPPARRVRMALELARANETEVAAILTPSQQVRLRQLALQADGASAFREPEVVDALELRPEQRERIRAIQEEVLFAQAREATGAGPGDPGKPVVDRILATLAPDQARRWKEIAGEPIRGTLNAFPMPFLPRREARRAAR